MVTMIAADNFGTGRPCSPLSMATPRVIVRFAGSCKSRSEKVNSFHILRSTIILTVDNIGHETGTMIRKSIPQIPRPSILAASRIKRGIPSNHVVII